MNSGDIYYDNVVHDIAEIIRSLQPHGTPEQIAREIADTMLVEVRQETRTPAAAYWDMSAELRVCHRAAIEKRLILAVAREIGEGDLIAANLCEQTAYGQPSEVVFDAYAILVKNVTLWG